MVLSVETFILAVDRTILYRCFVSSEKPALDPNTAKMWTLSVNDMDDDDVVRNVQFMYVPNDVWLSSISIYLPIGHFRIW